MTDDKLAQPDATMFERNIAHLARRGKEVELWLRGIPDPRIGLIAGLDDQYIQICITETQSLSQIRRDDIITLEETGQSLGNLIKDGILGEEELERVRERVEHFRRKAAAVQPKGH